MAWQPCGGRVPHVYREKWERCSSGGTLIWRSRNWQRQRDPQLLHALWRFLHVPHVCAVVIEGDQPVFTNLERSAEPGRRNGRGGTPAFDVVRMELRQVGVM